jgi:hypothetical protein
MPGNSRVLRVLPPQKPLTRHMGNGMVLSLLVIYLSEFNDKI